MGSSENQKGGVKYSGDEMKTIVVRSGKMTNLKNHRWNTLTAADQYEIRAAFDALSEQQVKDILSGKTK